MKLRSLGAIAIVLVGCSQPSKPRADTRRALLKGLGEQVFLPNYLEFEGLAADFQTQAQALCDAPNDDTVSAAENAWWTSRAPWKRNDAIAFGPYDAPTYLGAAIDFWPCRAASVDAVLAGTTPVDGSMLGAAAKGLPAIEYLLYEPELGPIDAATVGSRRCEYLSAIATDLVAQATAMRAAWDPAEGNFLGELTEAGQGSTKYTSLAQALGVVVNQLVTDVEQARNTKLGAPLGNRTGGVVQPDVAESRFSGRSIEDVRDNLRGVEQVCFGAGGKDAQSIALYLESIGADELVPELRDAFDASYAALDAIPEPLTEAIATSPDSVQAAVDAMAVLQRLIETDVIDSMGLMLTISDNDGD